MSVISNKGLLPSTVRYICTYNAMAPARIDADVLPVPSFVIASLMAAEKEEEKIGAGAFT